MEKDFGYRPPQSDPVVVRQAESARRLRRASAAPQQCSRNAASTSSAEDCPLAASLNLAEIRSMIDLLRVATVLVSPCVRKHIVCENTHARAPRRPVCDTHPPHPFCLDCMYTMEGVTRVVAMGQSQMPPLSLWRWGFETKTHRQICTNTNVCNHFIPSSLCDHVGETFRCQSALSNCKQARLACGPLARPKTLHRAARWAA